MPETMNRTSLKEIKENTYVNLERALGINSRLDGHLVSGHIDGTGIIENIKQDENSIWYTISADENLIRHIIEKGSIAIDGISLTVAKVEKSYFQVSIIPHTLEVTNLKYKQIGNTVNIECDIIGKYVDNYLNKLLRDNNSLIKKSSENVNINQFINNIFNSENNNEVKEITEDFLAQNGFL